MRSHELFLVFCLIFVATDQSLNASLTGTLLYQMVHLLWFDQFLRRAPDLSIFVTGIFLCITAYVMKDGFPLIIGCSMIFVSAHGFNDQRQHSSDE